MNRRRIFIPIALENLFIPFFFINLNEILTRIFNPALAETFGRRIASSFRPLIMAIFFCAVVIFSFIIYRILKPLFRTLEGDQDGETYRRARKAAILLPFVIIFLHTFLWALGTVIFFVINNWQAPGGVPFFWSFLLNTASGLNGSVFSALVANIILLRAKQRLEMSEIFTKENDFFIRNKDLLIVLAAGLYFFIYAAYAARFFILQPADMPYQLNMETSFLLLGAGFFVEIVFLLFLSRLENRRQIRFIKEKLEILARGEGDLTSKIFLLHFDEIGELCVTINKLIGFLSNLVGNIKQSAQLSMKTGGALSEVIEQTEEQFGIFRGESQKIITAVHRQGEELDVFQKEQSRSIRYMSS